MQDDIPLLALADKVGQAFPVDEVFRPGDAAFGCGGGKVAWLAVVVAFGAEESVDISVLMRGEAHVVDIGCGDDVVGHCHGTLPEAEVVDSVGAFGDGEERFAVAAFDAHHDYVFALPFHSSGVESGVDADALHEPWICGWVEVVFPERRYALCGYDGMCIAVVDTVALNGCVLARNKFLVGVDYCFFACFENIQVVHLTNTVVGLS